MPRPSQLPGAQPPDHATGGAAAVDRALGLLGAFRAGDAALGLAELAARTGLYKSTALRLLASLVHARLLQRHDDGCYALGPELARLHALYQTGFSLEAQALPVLRALVASTRESAALHVRHGEQRLCLCRVDSPQLLRDHTRAGDLLPLNRGAGGRVLLAFSGQRGALYAQIRRDGHLLRTGDRVPELTGISAPVWGADGALAGALTLTLPEQRLRPGLAAQVLAAAAQLSARLGAPGPGTFAQPGQA